MLGCTALVAADLTVRSTETTAGEPNFTVGFAIVGAVVGAVTVAPATGTVMLLGAIAGAVGGGALGAIADRYRRDALEQLERIKEYLESVRRDQTSKRMPTHIQAGVGSASLEMAQWVLEEFGEVPGGVAVSHDASKNFPKVTSLLYVESENSFLINEKLVYRPHLPAALVHLTWQKLDERGMPGCTITWDDAITFGGFDPDDPIGMMLIAADIVTYNMQGPYEDFERYYDLPDGIPDHFDDEVWDRATCTTDFRNQGFSVKGSELVSDGISIVTTWLPIKLVNKRNIPLDDLSALDSIPEVKGRAEYFASQLEHWKKDVAIDFVIRFTELVAFIKEVRAQGIGRQLPEGVYSSM